MCDGDACGRCRLCSLLLVEGRVDGKVDVLLEGEMRRKRLTAWTQVLALLLVCTGTLLSSFMCMILIRISCFVWFREKVRSSSSCEISHRACLRSVRLFVPFSCFCSVHVFVRCFHAFL